MRAGLTDKKKTNEGSDETVASCPKRLCERGFAAASRPEFGGEFTWGGWAATDEASLNARERACYDETVTCFSGDNARVNDEQEHPA